MFNSAFEILAGFMHPIKFANTPASLLWMLPLVLIIASVYKATKVEKVEAGSFIRESLTLFATIMGFMIVIAIVLWWVVKIFAG